MTIVYANFSCKCEDFLCPYCGTSKKSISMKERNQKVLCLTCSKYFEVDIFFTLPLPLPNLEGGLK